MVERIQERYGLSERYACRIVSQPRGTQRYVPTVAAEKDVLTRAIVALASKYGRLATIRPHDRKAGGDDQKKINSISLIAF